MVARNTKHGVRYRDNTFLPLAIAGFMILLLVAVIEVRGPAVRRADSSGLPFRAEIRKAAWHAFAGSVGKVKADAGILLSKLFKSGATTVEVDGRVLRPGPIRHVEGMTARDALLAAGGADRFGQIRRVHWYKNGHKVARLDLRKTCDLLVRMEPGDRLVVEAKVPWEN